MEQELPNDEQLKGLDQIYITRINWTQSRQNVVIALTLSTTIGAFAIINLEIWFSQIIYAIFVFAIIFEAYWIIVLERDIIEFQTLLEKRRFEWAFPRESMIKSFFTSNTPIKLKKSYFFLFIFFELLIFTLYFCGKNGLITRIV